MSHLAVALDPFGWHPAAWRRSTFDPTAGLRADHWVRLARQAQSGLLDFVTFEDAPGLQSSRYEAVDTRTDQVRGRLDAVLVAARLAPLTQGLGLVPTASTTFAEPFHVSTAIATLDFVSDGRAGWRPQVHGRAEDARLFGLRSLPPWSPSALTPETQAVIRSLFAEAQDVVEVVRWLWDSWEDDAVIRDPGTGRFLDRDRLHHVDFTGEYFSVKGPSITPRPPQGQPPVIALAHARVPYEFAARSADVVLVTPADTEDAARIVAEVRAAEADVGRSLPPLLVFADLLTFLDTDSGTAEARRAELDELDGQPLSSDAAIRATTATQLAEELEAWERTGIAGFRLRPGEVAVDLSRITDQLVPLLQSRGTFRRSYTGSTLREQLGLTRPANRYVVLGGAARTPSPRPGQTPEDPS